MWILLGALLLIVSLFYNYAAVKNRRDMMEQIEFIITHETNGDVKSNFAGRGHKQLITIQNELMRELRKHRVMVARYEQELKQTIANVTHDLRTPLTVISGYVQMLQAGEISQDTEAVVLEKIRVNITELQSQLEGLFEYSKLLERNPEITLENVALSKVTSTTLFGYYESFQQAGIELDVAIEEGITMITDPQYYARIIQNILGNMLVHGTSSGSFSLRQVGEEIIVQASNQMKHNTVDIAHVFDRFYTEDLARQNKNTGLGLYVVKTFAELLGGTVEAQVVGDEQFVLSIRFVPQKGA